MPSSKKFSIRPENCIQSFVQTSDSYTRTVTYKGKYTKELSQNIKRYIGIVKDLLPIMQRDYQGQIDKFLTTLKKTHIAFSLISALYEKQDESFTNQQSTIILNFFAYIHDLIDLESDTNFVDIIRKLHQERMKKIGCFSENPELFASLCHASQYYTDQCLMMFTPEQYLVHYPQDLETLRSLGYVKKYVEFRRENAPPDTHTKECEKVYGFNLEHEMLIA